MEKSETIAVPSLASSQSQRVERSTQAAKGRRAFITSSVAAATAVAVVSAPTAEAAIQGFCPIDGLELGPGFTVVDIAARSHILGTCKDHGLIERDPSKVS